MKNYRIVIEWTIKDTRSINAGFRTGRSTLVCPAKNPTEAMNRVIAFANNLPSWEFESNNIDLKEYREGKICTYHYLTQLSRIIKMEVEK